MEKILIAIIIVLFLLILYKLNTRETFKICPSCGVDFEIPNSIIKNPFIFPYSTDLCGSGSSMPSHCMKNDCRGCKDNICGKCLSVGSYIKEIPDFPSSTYKYAIEGPPERDLSGWDDTKLINDAKIAEYTIPENVSQFNRHTITDHEILTN